MNSLSPPSGVAKPQSSTSSATRGLHVITWGCQMNVYDSERMSDVLRPLGYRAVGTPDDADMIILNTCHIRDRAAEKVFSELGRLRKVKEARAERGEGTVLAVAGCVAQAEGGEILARAPYVDIVLGPQTYHRLPEMVARAARAAGAVIETDFPVEQKFDFLPADRAAPAGGAAFLTIQEGCDKFCSFCVVPYTRGAESSRPAQAVITEARRLVAAGVREITLLGQNVNAYHGDGPDGRTWGLARLARVLADEVGIERIRYTTSHPRDMEDDLIAAHRDLPQLMPFLHLPVQSGSDRVLAAMNRGHTADEYRALVGRLRDARPDLALSSDFIVGHPGETDADFADTMRLIGDIGFAQAYSFKYSSRPGTPAAGAAMHVAEDVKDARLQELQAMLRVQQDAFNDATVGLTAPVLFTGRGRKPGQVSGKSPWLQAVNVDGPDSLIGRIANVDIRHRYTNSLGGVLTEETDRA
ncbi:tRNA (N6-isopentenyl adenosine(37)-C2)-methylthiotransferase MiaB [Komagataeibacter xylinus]|nr:(dimethylallyl)adenosine tRNA methylthiotransferase [Komagataeibacter xylinus E25]RFP00919.1 tRNA (N6-isopentenyl adenosine(37)-C2)-methylthiotransferase MiaB [Komagataeibacter xylinus]RFP01214.1 tRNA (N6-isopentenyl adenosine(37)-C2)-methylthiotransferase MiaB [Komagataeibacter xylinus]